jgi:phosphate-selective porin
VQPFRGASPLVEDFQIGVAATSSEVPPGFPALHGETATGRRFYSSEYPTEGTRRRVGFEARWRPGPFSVRAERMRLSDERRGLSVEDTDLPPIVGEGWYVSGTWAVTGEAKADGLNRPKRPLHQGGPGAIVVAWRLEELAFRSLAAGEAPSTSIRANVIFGASIRATTIGLNWHPTPFVKVQVNAVREIVTTMADAPAGSAGWTPFVRFQFAF